MRIGEVVYIESNKEILKLLDDNLIFISAQSNTPLMNSYRLKKMDKGLLIVKKKSNIRYIEEPAYFINNAIYYASIERISEKKAKISFHLKNIAIFILLSLIFLFNGVSLILKDSIDALIIFIIGSSIPALFLILIIVNSFFVKKRIYSKFEKHLDVFIT